MNRSLFSSEKTDWETPQWLFDSLNAIFHFDLDVCATGQNAKCPVYFSLEDKMDGLTLHWYSKTAIWMNPPYGNYEVPCRKTCRKLKCVRRGFHNDKYIPGIKDWVKKACEESKKNTIVCLLPVRSDTEWWHNYILGDSFIFHKNIDAFINADDQLLQYYDKNIILINGRLKFGGSKDSAPFPSAIVVMNYKLLGKNE